MISNVNSDLPMSTMLPQSHSLGNATPDEALITKIPSGALKVLGTQLAMYTIACNRRMPDEQIAKYLDINVKVLRNVLYNGFVPIDKDLLQKFYTVMFVPPETWSQPALKVVGENLKRQLHVVMLSDTEARKLSQQPQQALNTNNNASSAPSNQFDRKKHASAQSNVKMISQCDKPDRKHNTKTSEIQSSNDATKNQQRFFLGHDSFKNMNVSSNDPSFESEMRDKVAIQQKIFSDFKQQNKEWISNNLPRKLPMPNLKKMQLSLREVEPSLNSFEPQENVLAGPGILLGEQNTKPSNNSYQEWTQFLNIDSN